MDWPRSPDVDGNRSGRSDDLSGVTRRVFFPLVPVLVILAAACGSSGTVEQSTPALSPLALEGRDLASTSGCASCHGANGEGSIGPAWVGLAGSDVELADGSTVTADSDYLRRSIAEPGAQSVAGFTIAMPPNTLTPEEIDAVVAYIEELS